MSGHRVALHRLSLRPAHTATNGSPPAPKAPRSAGAGSDGGPSLTTLLPDDVLKSILLAIDNGNVEEACSTANALCGVDTNAKGACDDDPGVWAALTKRVFGVDPGFVPAGATAPRAFFRELCALFKTVLRAINASDGAAAWTAAQTWCSAHSDACAETSSLWTELLKRALGGKMPPDAQDRRAVFKSFCDIVVEYRTGEKRLWQHRSSDGGIGDGGIRAFVLASVRHDGQTLRHASPELKNDEEVVLAAVENDGMALESASPRLKKDRAVVLAAVQRKGWVLSYADPEFWNDKDLVLLAAKSGWLRYASETLRADKEVVLPAVQAEGENLRYASPELKNDKEVVLAAAQRRGYVALEEASADLRDDADVVLAAVKNDIFGALKFASPRLKNDPAIVLAAVQRNSHALSYAAPALTKDKRIVLAAVRHNGKALADADVTMRADREVVLAAVRAYGNALYWASETLRNDREVVLAAVSPSEEARANYSPYQLRFTLKYASPQLQQDRVVVLTAVSHNGLALQFAPSELKKDKAVVLAAVRQNGEALRWAPAELKSDREVVVTAVREAGMGAYEYASPELQMDPEVQKHRLDWKWRGVW